VTDEHRAIIRRLVDEYLPHFEAGEAPTMDEDSFFMRLIDQAERDKIIDDDYIMGMERLGGWEALTDLALIGRAGIDDVRVLLTAGFRSSEHWGDARDIGGVWRGYAQAGTFTALLRRLDQLAKAG
jgi:hypothetical protein